MKEWKNKVMSFIIINKQTNDQWIDKKCKPSLNSNMQMNAHIKKTNDCPEFLHCILREITRSSKICIFPSCTWRLHISKITLEREYKGRKRMIIYHHSHTMYLWIKRWTRSACSLVTPCWTNTRILTSQWYTSINFSYAFHISTVRDNRVGVIEQER